MYNGGASDEIKEAEPYGKALSEKKNKRKIEEVCARFPRGIISALTATD